MGYIHSKAMNNFVCLFLAVTAFLSLFSHTPFGVAFSMDSLSYLSAAQQFSLGHGVSLPVYELTDQVYAPMALWPPLYPIILSLLPESLLFDAQVGKFLFLVNALVFIVFLYLFLQFIRSQFQANWIAWMAGLMLVALPSTQVVYLYAWSETFFIPVVFAAFCAFSTFVKGRQLSWLIATIVLLAIGFYLRYAVLGFAFALLVSLLLLTQAPLRKRLAYVALSVMVFALLVVPLLFRNYLLTSSLVGQRYAPNASLFSDFTNMMALLSNDFSSLVAINFVFAVLIASLVFCIWRKRMALQGEAFPLAVTLMAALWSFIYLVFLIVNRQLSQMDMDTRMIAPIMPLVLLVLSGLVWAGIKLVPPKLVLLPAGLLLALVLFNGFGVHRDIVRSWQVTGAPGQVLGITYNSITNKDLAVFYRLREVFSPHEGDFLITDLDRPQILHYFFPLAQVRQLPSDFSAANFAQAGYLGAVSGLLVMTKSSTGDLFAQVLGENAPFLRVQDRKGDVYNNIMLLKLPLRELK